MKKHVHIGWQLDPESAEYLRDSVGPGLALSNGEKPPAETTVLVMGRPSTTLLDGLPKLSTLIIPYAGLPPTTRETLRNRPRINVHNLHHNASSTAEMAIALMLAAVKRIPNYDATLRKGKWTLPETSTFSSLRNKSVLVMGYGHIGSRVAKICNAMEMQVTAVRKHPKHTEDNGISVVGPDDWKPLLKDTDILQLCLPATESTREIITEQELKELPAHAVLVNTGRASTINETALYKALRDQTIGAAGIDVWWQYPDKREGGIALPSNHPFHELENVVMTPHRAGDLGDGALEQRRIEQLAIILNALANGENAPNKVNLDEGY